MRKLSLIIFLALVFMSLVKMQPTPNPHGKEFSMSCDLCHSAKGWKLDKEIYAYDHNKSQFPLTGQHQELNCRLCHPTLVFKDAGTGCIDCHTDMHDQTVGPDCQRCHTTQSWIVENTTEMHQRSRFPLVGPHYTADCGSCHKSASMLRFEPLGVACADCHMDDYNATTTPDHKKGGYSTNCIDCHSPNSFTWSASNTDHSFFPLTGGHALPDCSSCHTNGTFSGLSKECSSCHLTDFNATTNPNHNAIGIGNSCSTCHTTNPGWKPAGFPEHNNYYVIEGAHVSQPCASCHNGNYNNTPNTCDGCHINDYNQTTNPPHATAQFPLNCESCHNQSVWVPSTFNHDGQYFPIYSGKHRGEWNLCAECHINPSNYQVFSCIDCHEHSNQAEVNNDHEGVQGYAYNSQACYDCHPTGEENGKMLRSIIQKQPK